ncbi:hypothetical protein HMPREF0322_02058 [Desulfitobacterium hafniense DP7]|uniref:Uncharacterized protein n=5 Tax=root TaxID=1 RepID=Q24X81_DESHY|nr:hypothetical protein HMPREF0322_02058 [Desulfitobacterium hafniense DP7]KTE91008.1 hypothetical protein AT727_05255 [Desulfitobacterium hafniense]BAE83361.1 hypothetical protein DSY1572 [Desulfitobacterium hafniense Y51]
MYDYKNTASMDWAIMLICNKWEEWIMDKLDLILERINSIDTSLKAEIKSLDEKLTSKMTSMETHMTSMDQRMTSMETHMTSMDQRMTSMETRMTSMDQRMTSMEARMTSTEDRITSMDRALRAEMKSLNDKVDHVAQMQKLTWEAVKDLDKEVIRHSDELRAIDSKVKAL